MVKLETLQKEIKEIKSDVSKILLILENEGEVREEVLKELEKSSKAGKEEYTSHEDVKRAFK